MMTDEQVFPSDYLTCQEPVKCNPDWPFNTRCLVCRYNTLLAEVKRLKAKAEFWEHRADCLERNKGLAG